MSDTELVTLSIITTQEMGDVERDSGSVPHSLHKSYHGSKCHQSLLASDIDSGIMRTLANMKAQSVRETPEQL